MLSVRRRAGPSKGEERHGECAARRSRWALGAPPLLSRASVRNILLSPRPRSPYPCPCPRPVALVLALPVPVSLALPLCLPLPLALALARQPSGNILLLCPLLLLR